ncbi:hypothetical protein BRADI_3g09034v3 [Brachypodium distachyon]|uniref:Uncharacterized protein n=1 Tax=Brachypodium distachyon TaxID=15368 RepID=A0A2K2CW47_BRADI|nr:hypothetical protein BRADI_5g21715v3 [Brachypodium distachyon]PNT66253.1 hypothetical protein BRADI_3g09034v3 [Brachypodium distachyon]
MRDGYFDRAVGPLLRCYSRLTAHVHCLLLVTETFHICPVVKCSHKSLYKC